MPPGGLRRPPGPSPTRTRQADALARVAEVLAEAGQGQQAEVAARFITDPDGRRPGPGGGALAEAGQHQQAEAAARSITNPDEQAYALARVAEALAQAGQAPAGGGGRPLHHRSETAGGRPGPGGGDAG